MVKVLQNVLKVSSKLVYLAIGSGVAAMLREKQVLEEYNKSLQKAYRSGIDEVLASGFGVGSSQFILFCNYALALWYGGKMILEKDYTRGSVLTITLAVLTASMSIGDVSLCFAAFAAGKAGAFKMLETINRNLEIDVYNRGIIFYDICGDIEIKTCMF